MIPYMARHNLMAGLSRAACLLWDSGYSTSSLPCCIRHRKVSLQVVHLTTTAVAFKVALLVVTQPL